MVRLKEEFDYKSLCKRPVIELDKVVMEHERQQKAFEDDIERLTTEAQHQISKAQKYYSDSLEVGSIPISCNLINVAVT